MAFYYSNNREENPNFDPTDSAWAVSSLVISPSTVHILDHRS